MLTLCLDEGNEQQTGHVVNQYLKVLNFHSIERAKRAERVLTVPNCSFQRRRALFAPAVSLHFGSPSLQAAANTEVARKRRLQSLCLLGPSHRPPPAIADVSIVLPIVIKCTPPPLNGHLHNQCK